MKELKVGLGCDLTDYLCIVGSRVGSRPSRCIFNCSSLVARIGEIKNEFEILMGSSEANDDLTHTIQNTIQNRT